MCLCLFHKEFKGNINFTLFLFFFHFHFIFFYNFGVLDQGQKLRVSLSLKKLNFSTRQFGTTFQTSVFYFSITRNCILSSTINSFSWFFFLSLKKNQFRHLTIHHNLAYIYLPSITHNCPYSSTINIFSWFIFLSLKKSSISPPDNSIQPFRHLLIVYNTKLFPIFYH